MFLVFLDRRMGTSVPGYRKDDYNWRYESDELSEDVVQASAAFENIQLDRKARNLTTSWRYISKSYFYLPFFFSRKLFYVIN